MPLRQRIGRSKNPQSPLVSRIDAARHGRDATPEIAKPRGMPVGDNREYVPPLLARIQELMGFCDG
jgi:hypothetical protein